MRSGSIYTGLRCNDCRSFFDDVKPMQRCPKCTGLLDTVFDEERLGEYSRQQIDRNDASMWRFRMFLPIHRSSSVITAGEGDTWLHKIKAIRGNISAKDETRNPTGTFKDRGASVAVTRLSQSKVRRIVLASEGNAGCSFAMYSRLARINCEVFIPRKANPAKVRLTRGLGARLTQVPGTIVDAGVHAARRATATRSYNASTFVTPYRHDGKGTMAIEICQELGWQTPDFVVYPIGGGVGLVGMWKMFKMLHRIGWTKRKPRFVGVQPAGCAPVVESFNRKKTEVEEWQSPRTIASGLMIPKPLAGRWILESLREAKGIAVKVTDREILQTMKRMAARDGMIIEPSSAAAFAAIPRLYESGHVETGDRLVVIATGSGLKTLEQF